MSDRRVEYTYDAQGRVLTCTIYYDEEVVPSYQYVYSYANGLLYTVTVYTPTKITYYTYTYNSNNQVTSIEKYSTDRTTPSENVPT